MKMPWNRENVRVLPAKIDLSQQPWCRDALLLHVRGTGALRWESWVLPPEADYYESARCLTLRGTPLLSGHFAAWETSESRLCTGWGLDTAECPELDALRETLNGGFPRLEEAVPALTPLLELLPEGVYVLAESDAYPADGRRRFFWDVLDCLEPNPATGLVYLNDDDYDYNYERVPPVFLYPSQRRSRLDMERVEHYQLRPLSQEKIAAGFGPFTVPIEAMNGVTLPKEPWKLTENSVPLPKGRLTDTELPEAPLTAGKHYPTAEEYALVSAAEISYPTDQELETWLADPGLYRPQLRGALVVLRSRGDAHLKDTALRCAAIGDAHCSLKVEAFQVLAELKGDLDVEDFFIDYVVNLEEPPSVHGSAQDDLTQIAHSFWD